MSGLTPKTVWIGLVVILGLQTAFSRRITISEISATAPELETLPQELGTWRALQDQTLDPSVTAYLQPDAYVMRDYRDQASGGAPMSVFIAYFKSLQHNYGPHSPRVCLPGSGWMILSGSKETLTMPGLAQGLPVNDYVMEKASDRIVVFYWYQNPRAVWAEESYAKLLMLPDLIRYRRSDASLVRIITPVSGGDERPGRRKCVEFAKLLYPKLTELFAAADGKTSQ